MFNLHQELLTDKPAANPELVLTAKKSVRTSGESYAEDHIVAEIFIDPLCAKSWAAEIVLRRIEAQFGNAVKWIYRTPGWLNSWEDLKDPSVKEPADLFRTWTDWSLLYNMPMNARVWLEDPPHSSYPTAIAFKAAMLQDPSKAIRFLRRIRELLFVEGRNISRWRTIKYVATEVGLDTDVLLLQYNNGDGLRALAADQKRYRELGVQDMPHLFVTGEERSAGISLLDGWHTIEPMLRSFKELSNCAPVRNKTELLSHFTGRPSLSMSELQVLTGMKTELLERELNQLEEKGSLLSFGYGAGHLWCLPG